MRVLAIDLGTSGAKAAVIDESGAILSTGRAGIETTHLEEQGAEQDPEEVWGATVDACRQALAGIDSRDDVAGIGVCSQYSSVIPMASADRAAMNMVVWMDQRGAPSRIRKLPNGERDSLWRQLQWVRIHGIPPLTAGYDSVSHMRFVKHLRPEVYENTWKFVEPMDFVTLRFTGRVSTTLCGAFMMLVGDNRHTDQPRYHDTLLKWSGIDRDKLPDLVQVGSEVGEVLPEIASDLGLSPGVKVWTGINDTQAGAIGALAFRGTHAGLSVGTTSVMITHVPFKKTDIKNSIATMPGPTPGTNLVMAENGIGGRAVEYFLKNLVFAVDGFADHSLEDEFVALHRAIADVPPGSNGVLFLPWLTGSMSPAEDGQVRGGFLNMSIGTTREDLGKAVLEGVALNFRWVRGAVEKLTGRTFSHLFFYSGGAVSDLWSQIIADVHQLPVHQAEQPNYTACRGMGLLALHWHGALGLDDFESRVPVRNVIEPRSEHAELYGHAYGQFVEAFRRNRKIFHSLNP